MNELERKLKLIEENINYLKNDSPLDFEEKQKKINELENERQEINNLIAYFSDTNAQIEELESKSSLSKEEKDNLKKLRESLDNKRKDYNKKYQGRYRNVLSAYLGQIDKRIHNQIYKNNNLWRSKNKRVNDRYANIGKYFLKSLGITAGIALVPGLVSVFVPAIAPYILAASSAYFGQSLIKTAAAIYNKVRYGGPKLQREYNISKDGWFENVKKSWGDILDNKLLSKNDVLSIKNIVSKEKEKDGLREPTLDDLKSKTNNASVNFLTLVSSMITSCDISKISNNEIKKIVNLVEKNNLEDKLTDNVHKKYLLLKEKLNKKEDSLQILVNSVNNKLEKIDVASLSKEEKEKIIKFIDDNKLVNKINSNAYDKYNQILTSLNVIEKKDENKDNNEDQKIEYINSHLINFRYNKATINDYEEIFKYVSDNDLEKNLTNENKTKYQLMKIIYDVMVKISNFDMNNYDINKAIDIVNIVKNNKITQKLNFDISNRYRFISKKLDMLFNSNEKKKENDNKDKLVKMKEILTKIDFKKLSKEEIETIKKYIIDNGLEKELSEVIDVLNNDGRKEPKMEDYGNKMIGITGDNQESLARLFINNPPRITRSMSDDMKNIAILAKKIKEGTATTSDVNKYAILIYNLTGQHWFQEEVEYYLDTEYNRYRKDKDEYDGKKAK